MKKDFSDTYREFEKELHVTLAVIFAFIGVSNHDLFTKIAAFLVSFYFCCSSWLIKRK